MAEPRFPICRASVSTRALEIAVERLPSAKYPVRLAVIDQELRRRKALGAREAVAGRAA